ncbi:MAG TPA: MBL fold metallo-hydrolase [Methanomassiliicoccales archaeon]|nr:MBL fold metallo-hydrolase [Methanomassiliicoccales archaeon]
MMPEVKVVCEGRIVREGGAILEAHSSCTLVIMGEKKMVVDTSSRQYRGRVLDGLRKIGFAARDVDLIVSTHGHIDHVGNDKLFTSARRIALKAGDSTSIVAPGVTLVRTPGHTPDSLSVFVEADENYAIAGDAMPTQDNFTKWVPPGIHYDQELALTSMKRIVEFADIIVPGHGPPFRVDR